MTAQDKDLLFRDLCARLPYRVRIRLDNYYTKDTEESVLSSYLVDSYYAIEYRNLRPYLRPMSSMTEEERKFYNRTCEYSENDEFFYPTRDTFDWLNAHHFDYRGLIPMGLALEAPENMYKTK